MRMAWRTSVMAAACCAVLLVLFPSSPLHAQGAWRNLFDGKTLNGWDQAGDANWTVKEGAIWGVARRRIPRDAGAVRRFPVHRGVLGDAGRQQRRLHPLR